MALSLVIVCISQNKRAHAITLEVTATVLDLKKAVSEIQEFGNIPIINQVFPWLHHPSHSSPAADKDLLSECNISKTNQIRLITTLSGQNDEKKVWKFPTHKTTAKGSIKLYKKIIKNWKRSYCRSSMQLGNDIFSLICSYSSLMIYNSKLLKVKDETNEHHDYQKCEDALPHGIITEFEFIKAVDGGWPVIGIMDENNKIYGLHPSKTFVKSNILWSQPQNTRLKRVWNEEYKNYDNYSHHWDIVRWSDKFERHSDDHPFGYHERGMWQTKTITVRVNLIDYLLTFWNTDKTGKEHMFAIRETRTYFHKLCRHPEPQLVGMFPIVIDLPKDKNIKWFPATYHTDWSYQTGSDFYDVDIKCLDQLLL